MEVDWVRVYDIGSQSQLTKQPTATPSKKPTSQPTTVIPTITYCQCNSCTQAVWDMMATDAGGSHSWGARI